MAECLFAFYILYNSLELELQDTTTTTSNTHKWKQRVVSVLVLYKNKKISPPPMAAVTEQPSHVELTTMDLLLKERGWDQSKFCQTQEREAGVKKKG